MMDLIIRQEESYDHRDVRKLLGKAFELDSEARLVDRLRENPDFVPELSIVADLDEKIVGYILFFPVHIVSFKSSTQTLALAPIAVEPKLQKKGIGHKLMEEGLKIAREMCYDSVIALGYPEYYSRFGFMPASRFGVSAPFEAPDEAFMALELSLVGLDNVSGTVRYPEEFDEV